MDSPHEFEGFGFVDIVGNPMAAWNVVRGNFYTPSNLPESERSGAVSFWLANLVYSAAEENNVTAKRKLQSEFLLEQIRVNNFPKKVSRLSGIFVFSDEQSALQVLEAGTWGAHFVENNLTDFGVSPDNCSRHDSKWINELRDHENKHLSDWEQKAKKYWAGEAYDEQPAWEMLVEGFVTVWGTDLRTRALQEVKTHWPGSLKILEYSANAMRLGSLDGAVVPFYTEKMVLLN